MPHGRRRRVESPGPRRVPWLTLAGLVGAGAVLLSGCDAAPDAAAVDGSSTGGPSASLVLDQLLEAFNAEDAEGVAGIFGDDVVYVLRDDDEELVGPDAAAFWQGYFGRETGERIGDPFHAPDGRTYHLARFTFGAGGSAHVVFDVEVDAGRLVGMGDRAQTFDEVIAAGEIDDLYEAFNDQDVDRLAAGLDGVTFESASVGASTGAGAAERWADRFGLTVRRTSGVFSTGDGVLGFVAEYDDPEPGRSTTYTVELGWSGGRITSVTERRPET